MILATDFLRETTRSYDRFSKDYSLQHSSVQEMAKELKQFADLVGRGTVLDVGSANGRDLEFFFKRGFRAIGIDLSLGLLQIAHSKGNPELARMDMRFLGLRSETFNGLWVCASFLHIPKNQAEEVLREFHRVMTPGALMYLSTKEGTGERFVESKHEFRRFFSFYRREEIEALLSSNDFELLSSHIDSNQPTTWIETFSRRGNRETKD
jgi:SAM-dependent methyltransferase